MKSISKISFITCTILTAGIGSALGAGWDTDGFGVVFFTSGNPNRIVFSDRTRPDEPYAATDRTGYDAAAGIAARADQLAILPLSDWAYGGNLLVPKSVNKTLQGQPATRVVVANVNTTSNPTLCGANATSGCATAGSITLEETCRYREIKVTGTASAGVEDPTGSASAGVAVVGEWTNGWKTCKGAGVFAACPPVYRLSYASKVYSATEERSRFNDFKFTTALPYVEFKTGITNAARAYCKTNLKGTWGGDDVSAQGVPQYCGRIAVKPSYVKYVRLPIQTGTVSYTSCRVIKDII
jgi:hypothetical protein